MAFTFSTLKQLHPHNPLRSFTLSHITPQQQQEHSKPTVSRRIIDKIQQGFSSFDSKDERVEKKPVDNEKRVVKEKDKNSRNRVVSKKARHNDSNEKLSKNTGDSGTGKRFKKPKKGKLESPLLILRLSLEICSKLGDVMASIGVVQPAKSGRSDTNSNNPELSNYNSENFERFQTLDDLIHLINDHKGSTTRTGIKVSENLKEYALKRGFEIYKQMVSDEVEMNEAILTSLARMAMSRNDGQMAFDLVKQMKDLGINPRLRSYSPALSVFCNNGNLEKAFEVEEHMLCHGVYPEEPELEALLRVSIEASRSDKVYYLLHKLRTSVRKVSRSTADVIEKWFKSKIASRIGKRKWDQRLIDEAVENGGGGWHGVGWLGGGKWNVVRSVVGKDGLCKCCGEKLATIDLDPIETELFAESVAKIARERERNSSFEKFQKWLDYYGPYEAIVDGANVGLFSQRRFKPSKVNTISNGIRQMLPSKKWPLIILHNKRINDSKMDEGINKTLFEKWKNADALYATPTGSNDDWYWLYAAIKFKCLLVTNDEMRDHLFQLLGNDFFPKWKERHQVRFHFSETGPVYHMPPPCSVVIQESRKGHWHIPIASEQESEEEREWVCVTREGKGVERLDSEKEARVNTRTPLMLKNQEVRETLKQTVLSTVPVNGSTILTQITEAEKLGDCILDFHI
ncbi:unnamed protein product [Lactuca saligna]|uniref:ribonuclease P n=1 Tax=Lactuca saligna TaxID=75948 RepID=A0AA35Z4W1_LACSI|nr:unnamed protein product [Lactuca saligna]